jgi:hypothetical protein
VHDVTICQVLDHRRYHLWGFLTKLQHISTYCCICCFGSTSILYLCWTHEIHIAAQYGLWRTYHITAFNAALQFDLMVALQLWYRHIISWQGDITECCSSKKALAICKTNPWLYNIKNTNRSVTFLRIDIKSIFSDCKSLEKIKFPFN